MQRLKSLTIVVAIGLFPFFFIGGPDFGSPRSLNGLWNFGHVVFFAAASFWLISRFSVFSEKGFLAQLFWVAITTLVVGAAIEFIQYGIQREPDIGDVGRDILGAIVAVVLFSERRHELRRGVLLLVRVLVLSLLALPVYSLLVTLLDEWNLRTAFPQMADFETTRELSRWSGSAHFERSNQQATRGHYSMRVDLGTEQYSGVALNYFERDWRGVNTLSVDVFNAEPSPFSMTMRIHDKKHRQSRQLYNDRFNRSYSLAPGWNHLTIALAEVKNAPQGRSMSLSAIENVSFFVIAQDRQHTLYIDNVYLK